MKKASTKLIAVLLSLIMLIGMIPAGALAIGTEELNVEQPANETVLTNEPQPAEEPAADEQSADTAAVTLGGVSGKPGDTVKVPLTLSNGFESGFSCFSFDVSYDKENLELTGVELGEGTKNADLYCEFSKGSSTVTVLDNSYGLVTAGGEFLVLTFAIKESAEAGDYAISIAKTSAQDFFMVGEMGAWEPSSVVPTITPGKVTVTAGEEESKRIEITKDDIDAETNGYTISANGVYHLSEGLGSEKALNITVKEEVKEITIVGNGVIYNTDETDTDPDTGYGYITGTTNAVRIDCTATPGVHLTIQDLCNIVDGNNCPLRSDLKEVLNFAGEGNRLTIKGTNLIDYDFGYTAVNDSVIHVGKGTSLTIDGDGTLYQYNCTQGAGIGGNTGETNGEITFNMTGYLFIKGTRQGAVIGAGANSKSDILPDDIIFNSGTYNIITNSRGAAIGGSAGANGASAGTNVYVNGGTISVNTDYSGAVVGGGGYAQGNDASGGIMYVSGGSLRPYVDVNAVNSVSFVGWDGKKVTEAGVNDAIITAQRKDAQGNDLYMCVVDTAVAEKDAAGLYSVYVDGAENAFYKGGLHTYAFRFDGVDRNVSWNTRPISTVGNWEKDTDTNLYFFLTGENHTIKVNGVEKTYYWDEDTRTFSTEEKFPVTFNVTPADAEIIVSKGRVYTYVQDTIPGVFHEAVEASEGVEASPAVTVFKLSAGEYTATIKKDGYYASEFSFQVKADGTVASITSSSNVNSYLASGVFTIALPVFTKSTNEGAWDGVTLDVSWYSESASTMYISTPAQLAGMAAIVNGIYNAEITTIIDDADGDGATETYTPAEYAALENSKINAAASEGDTSGPNGNNLVTSNSYWFGVKSDGKTNSDFNGQTVYITADIDMGGYVSGSTWTGARYMPIGGQAVMHYIDYATLKSDGYSHQGASFNGTIDGQGHIIKNIYCDRYATGANFGDSQSVGLIGRLGNHDNDPKELAAVNPTVRNIAVSGEVYARRSVGGVVGKIGQTSASKQNDGSVGGIIENCINFCSVSNTDSKGVGGIVGAGWNKGVIRNCANFGSIDTTYRCPAGGISGSNEVPIENCYNVGSVHAPSSSYAMGIGTNNGGASTVTNCFWLTGKSAGGGYYRGSGAIEITDNYNGTTLTAAEYMKSAKFLTDINGTKRGWVFASEADSIYALMSSTGNAGYPIPRTFINDETTIEKIEKTADPTTLEYIAGQTFDAAGLEIWATYSDGTKEIVDDYTLSINRALEATDTEIVVSGAHDGKDYSYTFKITVAENSINRIEIWNEPDNMIYAVDEAFDISGIMIRAYYANFPDKAVMLADTDYTWTLDDNKLLTISYTYNGKTVTETLQITYLSTKAPTTNEDGVYVIACENDLIWFANQVNAADRLGIGAIVTADLNMPETFAGIGGSSARYYGVFDGGNHTITLNMSATVAALFPYAADATIKNVIVDGTITSDYNNGGAAALVAYCARSANEGKVLTIENCVNKATIKGAGYTGGFTGKNLDMPFKITNCINYGAIINTGSNAGGIAAYLSTSNDGTAVIENCVNYGTITGTGTGTYFGGIAGYYAARYGLESFYIKNCMNYGDIVCGGNDVGGIVGYAKGKSDAVSVNIENCGNEGNVTGTYGVGGILGEDANYANVESCYNTADITGTGNLAYRGIGGIIGTNGCGYVTNVYNIGSISNTSTAALNSLGVGGVIGSNFGSVGTITNAYSAGTLSTAGAAVAGELAGFLYVRATFNNCYALDAEGIELIGGTDDVEASGTFSAKTAEEIKVLAETLGEAFKANTSDKYHGGYPVLAWEEISTTQAGDANGDGVVDATDAVLILRYYADAKSVEAIELAAADVNGDGIIDANDAVAVLRIYAET